MATAFVSWETISEVYAWNGTASFIGAGTVHIGFFNLQFSIEHSWDYEKGLLGSYVKALESVFVYSILGNEVGVIRSAAVFVHDIRNLSKIGRVRYYLNEGGKIAYEKVPNSSWSFALALYSS